VPAHYTPDGRLELRLDQELVCKELWRPLAMSGHELLLEMIPPRAMTPEGTQDDALSAIGSSACTRSIKPEWWKLRSDARPAAGTPSRH